MRSLWRVLSGLHTPAQSIVGAIIGACFGQLIVYLERFLFAFPASHHLTDHQSFLGRVRHVTKGEVPLLVRLSVCILGAIVFYKRELFDFEKRLHKPKLFKSKI